jgi:hypothetical protein
MISILQLVFYYLTNSTFKLSAFRFSTVTNSVWNRMITLRTQFKRLFNCMRLNLLGR